MRRLVLIVLYVVLAVPVSGQDAHIIESDRGEVASIPLDSAYLLIGDKISRSFRTDYFLSEGSIELEEGSWAILAVGLGGEDSTGYLTTDLELDFSPTRCVESLGDDWNNAFTITCPLRFFNFEIKTGYELTLMLIIALPEE